MSGRERIGVSVDWNGDAATTSLVSLGPVRTISLYAAAAVLLDQFISAETSARSCHCPKCERLLEAAREALAVLRRDNEPLPASRH